MKGRIFDVLILALSEGMAQELELVWSSNGTPGTFTLQILPQLVAMDSLTDTFILPTILVRELLQSLFAALRSVSTLSLALTLRLCAAEILLAIEDVNNDEVCLALWQLQVAWLLVAPVFSKDELKSEFCENADKEGVTQ